MAMCLVKIKTIRSSLYKGSFNNWLMNINERVIDNRWYKWMKEFIKIWSHLYTILQTLDKPAWYDGTHKSGNWNLCDVQILV